MRVSKGFEQTVAKLGRGEGKMKRLTADRHVAAAIAACVLLTSAVAQAAHVMSLGVGRGYDNGNLFQLVLTGNSMDTIRAALLNDGHAIMSAESFASAALSNQEVIILGLFDPGMTLTATEQTSLLNFVRGGGALIYMGDNDRFATSNASVAGMFGVTYSNDPSATTASVIINPNHPILNGPAGVVSEYDGSGNAKGFFGGIDRLGPHAHALLGTGNRTMVAVIERDVLQPGSGPVVFLSDVNGFMDVGVGGINRGDNAVLFRNILAFVGPTSDGCGNNTECNDGIFCNGVEQCVDASCTDGSFPCTNGQGCHENNDTCGPCTLDSQCNDGLFCNGVESCVAGVCQPGEFPCDGGLGCDERDDSCGQCGNNVQCDDGVFCNGLEVCVGKVCVMGSFPCHQGEGCHEDTNSCGPCTNDMQCDDNLFCDGVETCLNGECQHGTYPCVGGDGCNENENQCGPCGETASCEDGIFCNGMEVCNNGTCEPATDPACDTGLVCDEKQMECRPCTSNTECDDGLFCTGVETCVAGVCQPGTLPCEGLICEEDENACAKVSYMVVTLPALSILGQADELPESQARFTNGETVFAEFWAQTSHAVGLGCVYTDMAFGEQGCPLNGVSVGHQPSFALNQSGQFVGMTVNELGGCAGPSNGGLGVGPKWQRIGYVQLAGSDYCETEICLSPASTASTNFSGSTIQADLISYDCQTIEFGNCIYDLDGDDFVGPGDLALFASCWLCCEGDECFSANDCEVSDFDCDTCVGPGDLAFFATAWLADCADANVLAPPCQSTAGTSLPPADAATIRRFNLSLPPRGWPTTRDDWYDKMRATAAKKRMQQEETSGLQRRR